MSKSLSEITHTGRVKLYPDGSRELMACSRAVFREPGWELPDKPKDHRRGQQSTIVDEAEGMGEGPEEDERPSAKNLQRAARRARCQVRDLALCTPFRYFVTLTLDGSKVDRYDMKAITRKLNAWLSNQVQRRGLSYILVPEHHKDGAIHFHGFFNGALDVTDSGTMIPPEGGRPRRPRSARQREIWREGGGHVVWNLPGWTLGYTTAIELYGDYSHAVGYVCKYIGKEGAKPGGRWYYSGGELGRPETVFVELDWRELAEQPGAYTFEVPEALATFVMLREGPDPVAASTSAGD